MDKLQVRWSQTGQWARLNAQKHVFVGKPFEAFQNAISMVLKALRRGAVFHHLPDA
jgi:hypothetical protein